MGNYSFSFFKLPRKAWVAGGAAGVGVGIAITAVAGPIAGALAAKKAAVATATIVTGKTAITGAIIGGAAGAGTAALKKPALDSENKNILDKALADNQLAIDNIMQDASTQDIKRVLKTLIDNYEYNFAYNPNSSPLDRFLAWKDGHSMKGWDRAKSIKEVIIDDTLTNKDELIAKLDKKYLEYFYNQNLGSVLREFMKRLLIKAHGFESDEEADEYYEKLAEIITH